MNKSLSLKERLQRAWFFGCGMAVGLTTLSISFGSVPGRVTDDTALYQNLSEIRVARATAPSFDSDLKKLSQAESRYAEKLPPLDPKLANPIRRISGQKYQYTGNRKQTTVRR